MLAEAVCGRRYLQERESENKCQEEVFVGLCGEVRFVCRDEGG